MILSDYDIVERLGAKHEAERLIIDPLDHSRIQPASVDLILGNRFILIDADERIMGRVNQGEALIEDNQPFWVSPGDFLLATTKETVTIPGDLVGRVEGKSSLGRKGIVVHQTAGFIDPGFSGQITLEIVCVYPVPVSIRPGMAICQIAFQMLKTPCIRPYGPARGSHYQGQKGPTPAWDWRQTT